MVIRRENGLGEQVAGILKKKKKTQCMQVQRADLFVVLSLHLTQVIKYKNQDLGWLWQGLIFQGGSRWRGTI